MIPEPKFRLIIFGDGEVAEEIDKSPEEEEGVMGWKYIINPSEKLVKNYNLRDEMDENGFVEKWYKESDIDSLNDSVVSGRILIDVTFDGKQTPHSRRNIKLKVQLNGLEEENHILVLHNAFLSEKMRTMARNTDAYIKDNAEMIITARSAAKKEVGEMMPSPKQLTNEEETIEELDYIEELEKGIEKSPTRDIDIKHIKIMKILLGEKAMYLADLEIVEGDITKNVMITSFHKDFLLSIW